MSINRPKELKDTPVLSFVRGFYETLLNTALSEEEVIEWFTRPDRITDRIKYTSAELRFIRVASMQLDASG